VADTLKIPLRSAEAIKLIARVKSTADMPRQLAKRTTAKLGKKRATKRP